MNNWLKIIQHLLAYCLPSKIPCLICFTDTDLPTRICRVCERHLPHCHALPAATSRPYYDHLSVLFEYEWPIRGLINALKFGDQIFLAKLFALRMFKAFKPKFPVDVIVVIPLHPHKQQIRGYNQNIEIAKHLAQLLKKPLDRRSCTKIKDTASQSSLNATARRRNITPKIFAIQADFHAQHVLVIEDVVTTHTTINAFAQALKSKGVHTVEIWSCSAARISQ